MGVSYEKFNQYITEGTDSTNKNDDECPVIKTLNVIQGKWKEHILFFLCRNEHSRFGEINKAFPQISKTMLSTVLKQLEADGLVIRQQYNEIPPRTEYSLTESGKELMPVFYEMFKWGKKYL